VEPSSDDNVEALGDLTGGSPFDDPVQLWRCRHCGGYFAARRNIPSRPRIVGLYVPSVDLAQNKRINKSRKRWQALQADGNLCTCDRIRLSKQTLGEPEWEAGGEGLDERLPETLEEASRLNRFPLFGFDDGAVESGKGVEPGSAE
jgi:hypothetical protein